MFSSLARHIGRPGAFAALAALVLSAPALAQSSSPSESVIKPAGTYLRNRPQVEGRGEPCTFNAGHVLASGRTHDGAAAEAKVRAMPTSCSEGKFIGATDLWCEKAPLNQWECYRIVRCDRPIPNCKPGSRAQ